MNDYEELWNNFRRIENRFIIAVILLLLIILVGVAVT